MRRTTVPAQALLKSLASRYRFQHWDTSLPDARQLAAPAGVGVNYLDWCGSGEPILFLHGGALTAHSWDLVCLGLRHEWRCLALDMRGHGDSGWAPEYRVETTVDDIATVVTHTALERIHIVGNSLGGVVAAHYAAAHPSRVASLTLVDVGPNLVFEATQTIRDYIERTNGSIDLEAAVDVGMSVDPRIDRDALQYRLLHSMRQGEDRRLYWKQDRRLMDNHAYFLRKVDEIERLAPRLAVPVLVARGERSRVFSEDAARRCAALFARGECVRIENAGHNIQEANPAGLIAALRGFLVANGTRADSAFA